jgi:hypothetical protein
MRTPSPLLSAVTKPGALVFPENQTAVQTLVKRINHLIASPEAGGTVWHLPDTSPATGPRVLVTATGHGIVYGEHGHRTLYIDPNGTLLHECAWKTAGSLNPPRLIQARLQLDWGQWVGIKPEGLINEARFDISKKPGWQKLTRTDLHRMAAQAMGVTTEDVGFFYDDNSLTLDAQGHVTIRHRKDAFFILDDGTFSRPRFMACMGAMHWGRIDFLPVVELFQSLLAGTGSATFELIRGLYDDQSTDSAPRLLRYQGIPTYPSPQAFQLFSTYFVPEAPGGADPFLLFMDPGQSAKVTWKPRREAPRRFFDTERGLCVTVTGGAAQKVTRQNDSAALPYSRPRKDGSAPGGRMVGTTPTALQLEDGDRREEFPLRAEWGVTKPEPLPERSASPALTWRALFPEGAPTLDMKRAYFAVPLFHEDDRMVEDTMTQPLALEQTLDYLERMSSAPSRSGSLDNVLIHNWDLLLAEFIDPTESQDYTVLYTRPEFAQRQAQRLWDQTAASGRLSNLRRVAFLPADRHQQTAYTKSYGLLYCWIPFEQYRKRTECEQSLEAVSKALASGGSAILAGPPWLKDVCSRIALRLLASDPIAETAGVRMHRAILPKARVNPEATLFLVQKP